MENATGPQEHPVQIIILIVLALIMARMLYKLIFPNGVKLPGVKPGTRKHVANFPFYKMLSSVQKEVFLQRVQLFKNTKQFHFDPKLPDPKDLIKSWVAASAVSITWAYADVGLTFFSKVYIYNGSYRSPLTKLMHKGETNGQGEIKFAWNHFQKGFDNPLDGINLAIHEMAHAIKLENAITNETHGFITAKVLWDFDKLAEAEMKRVESGENTFFRKYASANRQEFFAVAVENFFERPQAFHDNYPEIYYSLCTVLKYDMLRLKELNGD